MMLLKPPGNMTDAQIDAGIDCALADAVREGWLVPTGKMKWSERRQRMIPIYKSLIYGRKLQ